MEPVKGSIFLQKYRYKNKGLEGEKMGIYNQPMYPMYQGFQDRAPAPQSNQGILWVQGESGAKSYLVAPGASVLLMDSEGERFYLKSTDASGMPQPLRVFEYKEVTGKQPQASDMSDRYVTRDEYNDLMGKYETIMKFLNSGNGGKKDE